MSQIVLNDVFNQWLNSKGIMSVLTNNYDVPWKNSVDGDVLDLEYHGNRSGNKIIAPLVANLIDTQGISDYNASKLAGVIYARNIINWNKLWDTLSFDYDPIANVNSLELTKTHKGEQTDSFNKGEQSNSSNFGEYSNSFNLGQQINQSHIGSQETTFNEGQQTTTNTSNSSNSVDKNGSRSTSSDDSIAGFNSNAFSNANRNKSDLDENTHESQTNSASDSSVSGSRTDSTNSGSRDDSNTLGSRSDTSNFGERNESHTEGSRSDTSVSGKRDDEVELTRKGNIGVTSSQSLVNQERKLWDWKFFDTVFDDVDSIVVIPTFGEYKGYIDGVIESSYVLPVATENILGGVKPLTKTDLMTQSIGVDSIGRLWTIPSVGDVISVNGKTGQVVLDYDDVGAAGLDEFQTLEGDFTDFKSATNTELNNLNNSVSSLNTIKQNLLVSGINISTINGMSLLDGGDIIIKGGSSNNVISSFSNIGSVKGLLGLSIEKEV